MGLILLGHLYLRGYFKLIADFSTHPVRVGSGWVLYAGFTALLALATQTITDRQDQVNNEDS